MEHITKTRYGIPCMFSESDVDDDTEVVFDDIFFLTFHTKVESEALTLARCVCGDDAETSLLILDENGDIWYAD